MVKITLILFTILWVYTISCTMFSAIILQYDDKKSKKEYLTTKSKIWFIIRTVFWPIIIIGFPFYILFKFKWR